MKMTLFDLLAAVLVFSIPVALGMGVGLKAGVWVGIGVGILVASTDIAILAMLSRTMDRRYDRYRAEVREKYRGIYRVVAVPTNAKDFIVAPGAEIRIGDYGWEAEPCWKRRDGLIYLQGLTLTWHVVWEAGFRPDQLEYIGPKPRSQYDWRDDYDCRTGHPKAHCPYAVQNRPTCAMGFP
jgi:hypothetical protein